LAKKTRRRKIRPRFFISTKSRVILMVEEVQVVTPSSLVMVVGMDNRNRDTPNNHRLVCQTLMLLAVECLTLLNQGV
jgi:hypothetical protein